MPDFAQFGSITTLHEFGTADSRELESILTSASETCKIGLILPSTAADMRAEPFSRIVDRLRDADFVDSIVVALGVAPNEADYRQTKEIVRALGNRAEVLWTDGPEVTRLYNTLIEAGFHLTVPGKGRSVWTAIGYLLADARLQTIVLHDCDIVDYERDLLVRLCMPMVHPSLDFDFCKAYYARCTDRMHGRVVRLLVAPFLRALISLVGNDDFLVYMSSFRYPLAGEFAVSRSLARSNRIPSDWGLEVGTLAEVFRNTSLKRVCQVDLGRLYEHKHQELSLDDPGKGLMKMATDILTNIFRTLASRGAVLHADHFVTLRSAYLRSAQDAIRQYHADALINGLTYDRHAEEHAIEGFAERITAASDTFRSDLSGGEAIPNWTRVLAAFPDFPNRLREAARTDAERLG
ncbi:MAG: glycosyl transferase [Planctomycetes bacterium]|nr:glycosyl transferase [Planctomycetota bacterium]